MIRSSTFVAALAVALGTLGVAPGFAVFHPIVVSHPAPPFPAHPLSRDALKVPFEVNGGPKAASPAFVPLRLRGWHFVPASEWYQPACYADAGLASPWTAPMGAPAPGDFTIGSLVDARSQNLFSATPSYTEGVASTGPVGGAMSGAAVAQYGFTPTPCGAADFFAP